MLLLLRTVAVAPPHSSAPPSQAGLAVLPLLLHAVDAGLAGSAALASSREISVAERETKRSTGRGRRKKVEDTDETLTGGSYLS